MKALTPAPLTYGAGLPAYFATPSCRSVSNHVGCLVIAYHHASVTSVFRTSPCIAGSSQLPAESSSLSYGPTVRLRLLSTSPRGDAVTFGYGVVAYSDTDFHRADVAPSRAHDARRRGHDGTSGGLVLLQNIPSYVFSKVARRTRRFRTIRFPRFVRFVPSW